jgi:hypothetical protein
MKDIIWLSPSLASGAIAARFVVFLEQRPQVRFRRGVQRTATSRSPGFQTGRGSIAGHHNNCQGVATQTVLTNDCGPLRQRVQDPVCGDTDRWCTASCHLGRSSTVQSAIQKEVQDARCRQVWSWDRAPR